MSPSGTDVATPATSAGAPPAAKGAQAQGGEKKKSKKKLVIVAAVALLLVAAVVLKGKLLAPHYKPGQALPPGQVASLGTLTTSLSDGHLVQTTVQLQLSVAETTKSEGKDEPQLLNAAISTLGAQTYQGLLTEAGRVALKAALLRDFQSVLDTPKGPQMVEKVYLTSFVLQ